MMMQQMQSSSTTTTTTSSSSSQMFTMGHPMMGMRPPMMAPMPGAPGMPMQQPGMAPMPGQMPPPQQYQPTAGAAPAPTVAQATTTGKNEDGNEETFDNYKWKDRDIQRFQNTEDTHVYCLTCKEHRKTDHSDETTCLQFCCCLMLLPCGLCCIPCCVSGCSNQYHKCDSCGTLLYSAKPCETTTSQYGDL